MAKAKELVSPTSAPYHTWRALTLSLRTGHRVESAGKVRSPIHLSAQITCSFHLYLAIWDPSTERGPLDAALPKLAHHRTHRGPNPRPAHAMLGRLLGRKADPGKQAEQAHTTAIERGSKLGINEWQLRREQLQLGAK